jgi:predicted small metal-binding protein
MTRIYVDCREFPSETNCTVTIAADNERELLEIAVQHAVSTHGHKDTPEFRRELKKAFKEGAPPA